jgi:hypothetical protein
VKRYLAACAVAIGLLIVSPEAEARGGNADTVALWHTDTTSVLLGWVLGVVCMVCFYGFTKR